MKILTCHNYYQQPGGEDESYANEVRLLRSRGHDVSSYTLHNDAIRNMGRFEVAHRTIWNRESYREVREILNRDRPDVMHCTNTFPLLSPSIYYAAKQAGVPVVQSLRNFRFMCLNGLLFRSGEVCEACLGKVPWPGVVHRCYRGSRSASAVVATMLTVHRFTRTWRRAVDIYVALTEFSRSKFIEAGIPPHKIVTNPNFVFPDPGPGDGSGGYAAFVGRLSPEKGVDTLLAAWSRLSAPIPLKIIGDGPLAELVRERAAGDPRIHWEGRRSPADVLQLVGDAEFLVMPSEWYETFGRTIIEAFSRGTPVVASRMGTRTEIVEEGKTGFLFTPADPDELVSAVEHMLSPSVDRAGMRRSARDCFTNAYSEDASYERLMAIYESVRR